MIAQLHIEAESRPIMTSFTTSWPAGTAPEREVAGDGRRSDFSHASSVSGPKRLGLASSRIRCRRGDPCALWCSRGLTSVPASKRGQVRRCRSLCPRICGEIGPACPLAPSPAHGYESSAKRLAVDTRGARLRHSVPQARCEVARPTWLRAAQNDCPRMMVTPAPSARLAAADLLGEGERGASISAQAWTTSSTSSIRAGLQ